MEGNVDQSSIAQESSCKMDEFIPAKAVWEELWVLPSFVLE